MPIYVYRCSKCGEDEEIILPMSQNNIAHSHSCGTRMQRIITVPKLVVMKRTGNEIALDSLNDGATDYMKPEHKAIALKGIEKPEKAFY